MKQKQKDGFDSAGLKCWREGTNVFLQNDRPVSMHDDFNSRVKALFPKEKERLSLQVGALIADIRKCDPAMLFMHCRIRFIGGMGIGDHKGIWSEREESKARALEYIQNIIVTHKCDWDKNEEPWKMRQRCEKVIETTENLYMEMLGFSLYYSCIAEQMTNDEGLQNFICGSQIMYLVRGKRDVHFNERYFSLLLRPHEESFRRMFNMSVQQVFEGILRIIKVLCNEKVMLFVKHQQEVAKFLASGDLSEDEKDDLLKVHECFWQRAEDIECFNVRKITGWSDSLLELLALPIGRCDVAIKHEYQFWPLDDFVIKDRPFVKIGSEYYCFDQYNFSDNIYRALFRIFKDHDTNGLWSPRQTDAIEGAVSEVFAHLLPGCKQLRNVRYFLHGKKGSPQEVDLVVLCPGMTIVVEAKGVWLRHTSPIVDIKETKAFYEKGIAKAGEQSRRFQMHLDKAGYIEFFDAHNQLVYSANRENLGAICRLCVTIDNANEITASTEKLSEVGVDAKGLICISLDDLLVYERYFGSPMVFMAYLRQRYKATFISNLSASDELDHLGFFINNPGYCAYVLNQSKIPGGGRVNISIDDNRRELDSFFASLSDPMVKSQVVYLPKRIEDVLDWAWRSSIANKSELADLLVCLDKNRKDWLSAIIAEELSVQQHGGEQHLRACLGETDSVVEGFCVCVNTQWGKRIDRREVCWRIKSMMVKCNENHRNLLSLEYDPSGELVDVRIETITMSDVEDIPSEIVDVAIAEISRRTVNRYKKANGSLGRNDPCPCGSGKKYKKCCGRLLA